MSILHDIYVKDKDASFRDVIPVSIHISTMVDVIKFTLCNPAINGTF